MFGKKKSGKKRFTFSKAIISIIILSIIGFAFVLWITYFYPMVENTWPVWSLFLIFYTFISILITIAIVSIFNFNVNAIKGSVTLSILFAVIDLWYPPYAVNSDGSLVSSSSAGYRGSIDYTFGFYLTRAGLSGPVVFYLTYLIIPIFALFLVLIILKPSAFKKAITRAA